MSSLSRVATPEHLGHQAIIVRRLVTRKGVLKRGPVLGKDLLEDTPVPRGLYHHRVAPRWGGSMVAVQRLYHVSSASSIPHQSSPGHPHLNRCSLSHRDFWDWENALSYTIKFSQCHTTLFASGGLQTTQRELAKAQNVFDNA